MKAKQTKVKTRPPTRRGQTATVKKTGIIITCPRCRYEWLYTGDKSRVICGKCKTSIVLDPKRTFTRKVKTREVVA